MAKKREIVRQALLDAAPLDSIPSITKSELRRALGMLTHDENIVVRQRACLELGRLISQSPPEKIKNFLRRLLWRLSEESGDYPVGVPELFGEIGHCAPQEARDFVGAFLFYLEDETLLPGLLQAAGRIGQKIPETLKPYIDEISGYLIDEDVVVAGNAALALYRIGGDPAKQARQALADNKNKISLFCQDKFEIVRLRDLFERSKDFGREFCFISNLQKDRAT